MDTSTFSVLLLNSRIRVVASEAACAAARNLWRGALTADGTGTGTVSAPDVEIHVDERLPLDAALNDIATQCNAAVLGRCRTLTVHAGVVASPSGAVVMPAVSGAGKSTLVGACVLAGMAYVSDEALHLGPGAVAVPYARPLGLSAESAERLGVSHLGFSAGDERLIAPQDLGTVAQQPVAVTHIVAIDRQRGAAPRLARLTEADAVHLLLTNSFNHYLAPRAALAAAAKLVTGAMCWRLTYGEATGAAALIADSLT